MSNAAIYSLLLLASTPVSALSCYGLKDHIFLTCTAGTCKGEFRAKEIHSAGACGRRTVVEPVPDGLVQLVEAQLKPEMRAELKDGSVQVTLTHRFYGGLPSNVDELQQAFAEKEYRAPRLEMQKLNAEVAVATLKTQWEEKANNERLKTILYRTIDWGVLLLALAWTFKTAINYRRSLIATMRCQQANYAVSKPLIVQAGLFLAAVFLLFSMWDFPLVVLVAPVVFLVWIYEVSLYGVLRFRTSRRVKI